MSEEEKEKEEAPKPEVPEEKPPSAEAPREAPAPEVPTAEPPPSPKKEETMVKPAREGAGNFLAWLALAVALGSLVLTGFFAYAKARPRAMPSWARQMQQTTTQELNALTARVVELEAAVKELQAQRGPIGFSSTLDLKKALVTLREVGRQVAGKTRKRVEQIEGALKALINELETGR